jgi:hypothetical protein
MTRRLLAAVVLAAAVVGCLVELERAEARDIAQAVVALRTARLGPTTRARLGTWFRSVHPEARLTWRAEAPGLFDDRALVELEASLPAGPRVYRFTVTLGDRAVEPLDASSRSLVDRVRAWAAQ